MKCLISLNSIINPLQMLYQRQRPTAVDKLLVCVYVEFPNNFPLFNNSSFLRYSGTKKQQILANLKSWCKVSRDNLCFKVEIWNFSNFNLQYLFNCWCFKWLIQQLIIKRKNYMYAISLKHCLIKYFSFSTSGQIFL